MPSHCHKRPRTARGRIHGRSQQWVCARSAQRALPRGIFDGPSRHVPSRAPSRKLCAQTMCLAPRGARRRGGAPRGGVPETMCLAPRASLHSTPTQCRQKLPARSDSSRRATASQPSCRCPRGCLPLSTWTRATFAKAGRSAQAPPRSGADQRSEKSERGLDPRASPEPFRATNEQGDRSGQ